MRSDNTLYVVVPCYKEEEVLPETSKRLKAKLTALIAQGKISPRSRILFVNDGSKDRTWPIIEELHAQDRIFSGVNLSRNAPERAAGGTDDRCAVCGHDGVHGCGSAG